MSIFALGSGSPSPTYHKYALSLHAPMECPSIPPKDWKRNCWCPSCEKNAVINNQTLLVLGGFVELHVTSCTCANNSVLPSHRAYDDKAISYPWLIGSSTFTAILEPYKLATVYISTCYQQQLQYELRTWDSEFIMVWFYCDCCSDSIKKVWKQVC